MGRGGSRLKEIIISVGVAAILSFASLFVLFLHPKLPARHRDDETNTVVRLVANIFVVVASLAFGLIMNSSKNTFENIDASVHSYATNLILLDLSLKNFGLEAFEARSRLKEYVAGALAQSPDEVTSGPGSKEAQARLDRLGQSLFNLKTRDPFHQTLAAGIQQQYSRIVEQRWGIVERSEGVIPAPVIMILVAWLTLIFASYGYRAPRNGVVVTVFLSAASLIGVSVYVVLDMDMPFRGLIQISDEPLQRAFTEMAR